MSFILDALKKSESDRQQQGGAEFSAVPSATPDTGAPRWIWALVALLVINAVAVAWLLLQPQPQQTARGAVVPSVEPSEPVSAPAYEAPASEAPSFAAQVAEARAKQPDNEPETQVLRQVAHSEPGPAPVPRQTVADDVPTLLDLRARGELALPDLHLDIHVYSEAAAERFVFVNMVKHREGSVLAEGPRVSEITVDGVVLDYQGRRFKLPRE